MIIIENKNILMRMNSAWQLPGVLSYLWEVSLHCDTCELLDYQTISGSLTPLHEWHEIIMPSKYQCMIGCSPKARLQSKATRPYRSLKSEDDRSTLHTTVMLWHHLTRSTVSWFSAFDDLFSMMLKALKKIDHMTGNRTT